MNKIFYSDIDSCLLNFNIPWEKFIRDHGVHVPYPGYLQGHCRLTEALGLDEDFEMALVTEFFASDYFYHLPAMDGAKDALGALYNNGWRFIAVSACPEGESVCAARKTNLERVLDVPFEAVYSTGVGGCKRALLSTFEPTIFVEDHYGNALAAHELGYRTFLMNHFHNSHHAAPMARVDSWSEITDQLL